MLTLFLFYLLALASNTLVQHARRAQRASRKLSSSNPASLVFLITALVASFDLSVEAATITCASFSASNTAGTTQNYATCDFAVCNGDSITISSCGCTGDTYLRLYDSGGSQITYIDDSGGQCGSCSVMSTPYVVSGSTACSVITIREGCYGTESCSGTVTVSGVSEATASPSTAPTPLPAIFYKAKSEALTAGNLVGTVSLPQVYEVSFEVFPTADSTKWRSILHLTTGLSNSSPGSRLPAIFFCNSDTCPTLGIQVSYIGSDKYSNIHSTQAMPLNQWTIITISIDTVDQVMTALMSGGVVSPLMSTSFSTPTQSTWSNVQVYAADPASWVQESTPANIRNIVLNDVGSFHPSLPIILPFSFTPLITIAKGNLVGFVALPSAYSVVFDINPVSADVSNACANILRLNGVAQHEGPGSRLPGLWFNPGKTSLLLLYIGEGTGYGEESSIGTNELPVTQWSTVTITINLFYSVMSLSVSGATTIVTSFAGLRTPSRITWPTVSVYASDLLETAANAQIKNLVISAPPVANLLVRQYTEIQARDSNLNDLFQKPGASVGDLMKLCDIIPTCVGFNTGGWLKNLIKPIRELQTGQGSLFVLSSQVNFLLGTPKNMQCNDPGYYLSLSIGYCSQCSPGAATQGTINWYTQCQRCPAGKFSNNWGSATCSDCASGTTSLIGSDSCPLNACASSYHCTTDGFYLSGDCNTCYQCAAGTASQGVTTFYGTCPKCPVNQYSTQLGSTSCSSCGTQVSLPGATSCASIQSLPYLVSSPTTIAKSNLLGWVSLPSNYEVSFRIKPTGDGTGWRNIVGISGNNENNSGLGSRLPTFTFCDGSSNTPATKGNGKTCPSLGLEVAYNSYTNVGIFTDYPLPQNV